MHILWISTTFNWIKWLFLALKARGNNQACLLLSAIFCAQSWKLRDKELFIIEVRRSWLQWPWCCSTKGNDLKILWGNVDLQCGANKDGLECPHIFYATVIHYPRISPNCVYLEDSQCYFYPLMHVPPSFIVIHYVLSLESGAKIRFSIYIIQIFSHFFLLQYANAYLCKPN